MPAACPALRLGLRRGMLDLQVRKSRCLDCGRCFRQLHAQKRLRYLLLRSLGRSEAALDAYFLRLEGKEQAGVVCMDLLAPVYRLIVKKQFPQAVIAADRLHVIRRVKHPFLACWRRSIRRAEKTAGCSP